MANAPTRAVTGREVGIGLACFVAGLLTGISNLVLYPRPCANMLEPLDESRVRTEARVTGAETCAEPAFPVEGLDSDWYFMKWIPPPARCTVQGFPIERLEPVLNYRRGFSLGYTTDGEDKTHLLPYLRAAHDMTLASRRRRVYLDLGGRDFGSSCLWFLRMYPLAFSEIHVFEQEPGMFQVPARGNAKNENLYQSMDTGSHVPGAGELGFPDDVLNSIHLHEISVGGADIEGTQVNITRFIKEDLKLTAQDAVIIKMDIDFAEWQFLRDWPADHEMAQIVDELFVEVHYNEVTMSRYGWTSGPPRATANRLFQELRGAGYYVHPWP